MPFALGVSTPRMTERVWTDGREMAWHNQTMNETSTAPVLSDVERPVVGALLCLVSATAFLGNVLVLLAFGLSGKLRHTANYFVVNLSVADLITSLTGIRFKIKPVNDSKYGSPDRTVAGGWNGENI